MVECLPRKYKTRGLISATHTGRREKQNKDVYSHLSYLREFLEVLVSEKSARKNNGMKIGKNETMFI